MIRLYIVVPCYNEEAVLPETTRRLSGLLSQMSDDGLVTEDSRVVYVNDGSSDKTWEMTEVFFRQSSNVCGVKLARNAGHQNALMAGLTTVHDMADAFVTIDADLQDDIMAIPEMVRKLSEGNDIVYGVRNERKTDTLFKKSTALLFYRLMEALGVKTIYNHADFRLMSRRAVEQLLEYKERNLFLRGIVPLIGYRTAQVYYNRDKRFAGESKYPLMKMLNFAIDGITSFSVKPVRLVFTLGLVFIAVSLLILVWVMHAYLTKNVVPGWASLMLSIWFVGGCVLVGLGVVGEYVGKIYTEVKARPRFNIEETLLK